MCRGKNNLSSWECRDRFYVLSARVNTSECKHKRQKANSCIFSIQLILIPPSDALPTLRKYIHTKGMDSFSNNKLYKISPIVEHLPPLHQLYSRKEQVILNRLLIGHTHLTHSYLRNKEQPPNSNYCKSPVTVEHILTSCSAYKNIKRKALLQLPALTHLNQHF